MKFGILNFNTTFLLITVLGCTAILSYFIMVDGLLFGDLIFIAKFFLVVILLIHLFLIGFIGYKFRLISITNKSIYIFYPFRFLIISSKLENINKTKWSNYIDSNAIFFRQLSFKTEKGKSILICDKEFENLDSMAKAISKDLIKSEKLKALNIKRAKTNRSNQIINVLFSMFLICAAIYICFNIESWNPKKFISMGLVFILIILLLISNVRRYLIYKKVLLAPF